MKPHHKDYLFYFCCVMGLIAWVTLSNWLSAKTGMPLIAIALAIAGTLWLIMDYYEKRIINDLHTMDEKIVFCNLSDAINSTDYKISDQLTLLSLSEMGFTPKTALGKDIPMYGETLDGDIFFSGTIIEQDGEYFIRRLDELQS